MRGLTIGSKIADLYEVGVDIDRAPGAFARAFVPAKGGSTARWAEIESSLFWIWIDSKPHTFEESAQSEEVGMGPSLPCRQNGHEHRGVDFEALPLFNLQTHPHSEQLAAELVAPDSQRVVRNILSTL